MITQPRQPYGRILSYIAGMLVLIGIVVWYNRSQASSSADSASQPAAEVAAASTTHSTTPDDAITAHYARIQTNYGDIIAELYPDSAPKTVANFATLAKRGYYNTLTFHRVVKGFVIQGGDPNGDGTGGESIYGPTFNDEINAVSLDLSADLIADYTARGYTYRTDITSHKMEIGSVAMANRGANTNGSQFFIVTGDIPAPGLDGRHTVFGKVVQGMDVVMKINDVPTGGTSMDHPKDAVTITTVIPGDTIDAVTSAQ